jgi:tRNA pseudouridine synthase 10
VPKSGAYALCGACLSREGPSEWLVEARRSKECSVCEGLMDTIPAVARRALKLASSFEFRTFTVGISMPQGPQEREDEIRSLLKMKGNETIKIQAARMISAIVARATRKKVDKSKPDLTFLVRLGPGKTEVTSRSLFFYGRYAKPSGVSQRREPCRSCSGSGCLTCRFTGFGRRPSVEGAVSRKLKEFTAGKRMTFSWLGTEDRESRVFPPGRPFVVEVRNPRKREVPSVFALRSGKGKVVVGSGRVLHSKPVSLPRFRFRTRIVASAASKVDPEKLSRFHSAFKRTRVTFDRRNDGPVVKTVYSASARPSGRRVRIEVELDGGLPVKRFVSGESVTPSAAEVLGTPLSCEKFDILGVTELGKLRLSLA